jgi:tetratricopeptide (TPR) repeat protein
MAWAFEHGFWFSDDLPAQLDRWVAARPQSWMALTIRGAMWKALAGSAPDARAHREAADRATADLERAIALHPRAVVAHAALIELAQAQRDPNGVEARYRAAIAADPVSMRVLMATVAALEPRFGGSRERAVKVIEAARLLEKRNPRIVRLYGYPDALRAEEIESRLPAAVRNRYAHLDPALGEQIIRWYTRALRYEEPASDWHYRRAETYRDLRLHEFAVADADFALVWKPKAERFWSLKAYCLSELGRLDDALATARAGLSHLPESRDLRWYEADALYRMGRYEEAAELHRAALAKARTPQERRSALGGLAAALMKLKRWAEAEPLLAEATRLDPWHALTWHSLGEARWNLGRREEAAAAYEQFVARSEGKTWFDEQRMRAQERIELVRSGGAKPPASARPR